MEDLKTPSVDHWWGRVAALIEIRTNDSGIRRKGQLLALFIGLSALILVYLFLNDLVLQILRPNRENLFYLIEDLLLFVPLFIFWKMNQYGWVYFTAYIAIFFTILAGVSLSHPIYIEYTMVAFALPVGMSSFIIKPHSSIMFAAVTTIAYTVASLAVNYIWEYNLTAVVALFALAFMTWVTSQQWEYTLQQNTKLVEDIKKTNRIIEEAYDSTLEGWSHALEVRDRETEGHTKRVTEMTVRLARRMGFDEPLVKQIQRGALLHDIGKLGIPDDILQKPGSLTEKELRVMRLHPQIAVDLLTPIEYLKPALDIPRYHHEKWDGTGYPHGLKGEEIPIEARIFAIIDVYDALTHDRVYRQGMPKREAVEYIKSESGRHFDPAVVEIFLQEVSRVQY